MWSSYGSGWFKPGFHSNAIACVACVGKRKPQETQALALASSQSWLPLLRSSIPTGWRLRLLREMPTQALAFLAVFVYATHATQAIGFEWKPGLRHELNSSRAYWMLRSNSGE